MCAYMSMHQYTVCMYVYVYMPMCVSVCMYAHAHTRAHMHFIYIYTSHIIYIYTSHIIYMYTSHIIYIYTSHIHILDNHQPHRPFLFDVFHKVFSRDNAIFEPAKFHERLINKIFVHLPKNKSHESYMHTCIYTYVCVFVCM